MDCALSIFCYGAKDMNPKIDCALVVESDDWFGVSIDYPQTLNTYDMAHVYEPKPVIGRTFSGNKRLASDGLRGVVADNIPTDATVVILQEIGGMIIEMGRTTTEDGSWSFSNLPDAVSHAVAFRTGFNAGITSGIQPED